MSHPADAMVESIFGGRPSPWDERRRRQLAIVAFEAGKNRLRAELPYGDDDLRARAIGALAASLGH